MLESGDIMIKFQTINVMNQLVHFGERLHFLIKLWARLCVRNDLEWQLIEPNSKLKDLYLNF